MNPSGAVVPRAERRIAPLDLAILAAILLLGAVNLPQPFGFDQALFTIGARKLEAGAVLYRDFWDVKQPGIYVFYLLGGRLFGFSEVGIHLFELLYMMAFSVTIVMLMRRWFEHRWGAALAAFLSVGYFYAFTSDWHLTQVEAVAGFPLFLTLWFSSRAGAEDTERRRALLWAGVLGGIVVLFKMMFVLIVGGFWLTALAARAIRRPRVAGMAKDVGALALGALLPILPVFAYLAAHRELGIAWWTFFEYPAQILGGRGDLRLHALTDGLTWFFARWSPLLALGFFGVVAAARRGRDLVALNLALWIVSGLAVILMQRLSYWQYHYVLLTVPAGILAARGIDLLALAAREAGMLPGRLTARALLVGGVVVLCSWAFATAAFKAAVLVHHGFARTLAQRVQYERRMSRDGYPEIRREVAFLASPSARPGPFFVLGNPLFNWLSGRDQGVPRHGGILWGHATTEDWRHWTADLRAARPPYILVQQGFTNAFELWPERCASFLDLLSHDYRVMRRDSAGVWYERRVPEGRGD